MKTIMWLEELGYDDLKKVGGKGANLGEMAHAGMPVPCGFVVSVDAYRMHLAENGINELIRNCMDKVIANDIGSVEKASSEISEAIINAPIPERLSLEIASAYSILSIKEGGGINTVPVAVRSSATAEDLPGASFAGQQETYLNIKGEREVLRSVRRCWASLWSPRAISYRMRMGYGHSSVHLAVVIQAMIEAEIAGVMFTANPMSGSEEEIMITANYGLGESVVSGLTTPDTFVVSASGAVIDRQIGAKERRIVSTEIGTREENTPENERAKYCLDDAKLRMLAGLARKVFEHYGKPQDIEWAIWNDKLYLLQSRPITAFLSKTASRLKNRRLVSPKDIAFRRMVIRHFSEHIPDPVKPIDHFIILTVLQSLISLSVKMGLSIENPEAGEDNGNLFIHLKRPRLNASMLWKIPSMFRVLSRENPGENWHKIRSGWEDYIGEAWRFELDKANDGKLIEIYNRIMESIGKFMYPRFEKVVAPGLIHDAMVKLWTRIILGKKKARQINRQLFLNLPYRTSQMNTALGGLAVIVSRHGKNSPEFNDGLRNFLTEWGDRPTRGMIALSGFPTWNEDATMVNQLIDAMLKDAHSMDIAMDDKNQALEYQRAYELMSKKLGGLLKQWFDNNLRKSRDNIVAREDSVFFFEKISALRRRVLLHIGSRMNAKGILDDAEDVFFLLSEEIAPAIQGETSFRHRVSYRKKAYSALCSGQNLGENHLEVMLGAPHGKIKREKSERQMTGISASEGKATGPVCVVKSPDEFGKLKNGDILVAPATTPIWTPLFSIASAVVTDAGGPLSHAAIVAREYGIPAVLGTSDATSTLSDGQVVTVDGTMGRVYIHAIT